MQFQVRRMLRVLRLLRVQLHRRQHKILMGVDRMRYKITQTERDYIQALYYDKIAKEELLCYCCRANKGYDLAKQFEKLYSRAVEANKKYHLGFDKIVRRYLPEGADTSKARIEFAPCEIVVEG